MNRFSALGRRIEVHVLAWAATHSVELLRVSLGIVFLWFGALKFFPELSPAQELAARTIDRLTFGVVPSAFSLPTLAVWECMIGLGFISGVYLRATLFLLFAQMFGTITSIFFFPHEMFNYVPYAPTLEGQYVIKNLVLISAGVVIGGTLRDESPVSQRQVSERRSTGRYHLSSSRL